MTSDGIEESYRINRIVSIYNILPNVVWSVLSFGPVFYFCYYKMEHPLVFLLLTISVLPGFLPNTIFKRLQWTSNKSFYEKARIKLVKKLTQDGDIINQVIRKRFPRHRRTINKEYLRKNINKSFVMEKFHFQMLLFFLFVAVYALFRNYFFWSISLILINIVYNVYPILLQQYNRLRFNFILKKQS